MENELAWVILQLESIHFLNNEEMNLALQLMVFHVPWKIECWYFDSYNWEWNIVVKPTDIGCRALTLKTAAKRSPIYIRLTSNVLCPAFFILGKNQRKIEFHKYEIIVSWTFNSKICLQLRSPSVSLGNCEVPYKTCIFLQNWWCGQQPEIFPYCIERNISYELPEIFLSSYPKYFLRATRNISMLHLECCTYSTEKFSWQGLAKSEMDSGKECSVQFWAPNGSNKLLESFLRASSLPSSFLCSWIDGFDVTLILRNQSLEKYNQQASCTLYLQNICRLMSHLLKEFFLTI